MENTLNSIISFLTEFYQQYGLIAVTYVPIGIIGIWRWSVFIFKKRVGRKYRPVPDNEYEATLGLVIPVYNEDPDLLARALESWIANDPDEIIAVIDQRDTRSQDVFRRFQEKYKDHSCQNRMSVISKEGKRAALVEGFHQSSSEIIALVDSDTLWEKGLRRKILSPFIDESVGGVAPRQRVLDVETPAQRVYGIQIDSRYDEEMPFLTANGDAITCISGRTAVFRREALAPVIDGLLTETFARERCISGDDKFLTRMVQGDGWAVRYQSTAVVYINAASDWMTYFKQKVRWTRNSWRSDLKSLFDKRRWMRHHKRLRFHTIDRFIQPFTLILSPIFFFLSIYLEVYLAAAILMLWWFGSRTVKIYPHLKRNPGDISILWHYVVVSFVTAVIKIYAWFSVARQGWKTRWDKDRLIVAPLRERLGKSALSGTLTAAVVIGLTAIALEAKSLFIIGLVNNDYFVNAETNSEAYENIRDDTLARIHDETATTTYRGRSGDTLLSVARKFNVPIESLQGSNPGLMPNSSVYNQSLVLLVKDLRETRDPDTLTSVGTPEVTYVPVPEGASDLNHIDTGNIVIVSGRGSVVTIPQIYALLEAKYPGQQFLVPGPNREWTLNASLEMASDVVLVMTGDEVSWLKLKSNRDGFVWLASFNGGMYIADTKVTSWDTERNTYDTELEDDGRSFVLTKDSGRTDILRSELAYLGYSRFGEYPRGDPFGGIYGVAWRIQTGTFDDSLVTGNVIDSRMHNNQFGFYTYGAVGMIIQGNAAYDNIQYGFDPHDDSNYLIMVENEAYDNGNHGIITSKRCLYNIIARNRVYDNAKHGIMLDQDSNFNLIEDNISERNLDGIVAFDSHNNVIRNNRIFDSQGSGIRLNVFSSQNYVIGNILSDNSYGVYVYDNARENLVAENIFVNNDGGGVYMKNTENNMVIGNDMSSNRRKLRLGAGARDNTLTI